MIAGLTRRNLLALMGTLAPAAAVSAPYPEKPVRLIVALAPGGPADTAARVFAPAFAEALGQNVLVDNRPGGSAVVGTEAAVRAAPDGYTLLFASSSTLAINPAGAEELAVRRAEGTQADWPDLLHAARAGGACRASGADVYRSCPAEQSAAGHVTVRLFRHRRRHSPGRRTCQDGRPAPICGTSPIAAAARPRPDCSPAISTFSSAISARRQSISAPAGSGRWRWPGRRARRSLPMCRPLPNWDFQR